MLTDARPAASERVTLYFRQGGSDKVYHAAIEPKAAGFIVTFAYGRRGSTLTTGTKSATPMEYAAARKIYDKLVKEKRAKGYTRGESGTPYQQTDKAERATGILPQLLNAVDESEVDRLLADDDRTDRGVDRWPPCRSRGRASFRPHSVQTYRIRNCSSTVKCGRRSVRASARGSTSPCTRASL